MSTRPLNILLVEPSYRTKFPPLGLMKLSTYHKGRGDNVTFYKGLYPGIDGESWDRIYITTLFTYTWDITVKTIKFYKGGGENGSELPYFNRSKKIYIGGIMASMMQEELANEVGIPRIIKGRLTNSSMIDMTPEKNIDELPPDYSILDTVDFPYSYTDAYLGYATRGCPNKCDFCAVPTIEPVYEDYIDIKDFIRKVDKNNAGVKKQNLILMDNNVLKSNQFNKIIDDILEMGFEKGGRLNNKKRTIDFNQGLDARLLDEHKMKRLSEIALKPMRLAYDDIKLKEYYVRAVRLAHRYEQKNMSNYILFNYRDKPADLYNRLKDNIDLNEEFRKPDGTIDTSIYSFPMRFMPLKGAAAKKRGLYVGEDWNRRYLRSVQCITNVVHGSVMPGRDFFFQAFGRSQKEFRAIMLMPDEFIIHRCDETREDRDYVTAWKQHYSNLNKKEENELIDLLGDNNKTLLPEKYKQVGKIKLKKFIGWHIDAENIVSR